MDAVSCKKCGVMFDRGNLSFKKFCSNECCVKFHNDEYVKLKKLEVVSRPKIEDTCVCGLSFVKSYGRKFCSRACMFGYHRKKEAARRRELRKCRECVKCGSSYIPRSIAHIFCTRKCREYKPPKPRYTKEVQEARRIYKTYGITSEQVKSMIDEQDGACAICGETLKPGRGTHIDHSHSGKKSVRGILCTCCNIGLGMFRDDVNRLSSAASYLHRFS